MNERKSFQTQNDSIDTRSADTVKKRKIYKQCSNKKLEKICITNVKKLNSKAGITLIALVISIIVMLILAGVSLNATIGDNGIITQAQNATYAQSLAFLEEKVNYDYVNNYNEDNESILQSYIRQGYVERILTSGENNTIDIKYIFNKEKLPEEWKENLVGGNGTPAKQKDVYGVNSTLKCWYINSDGTMEFGKNENLIMNENEKIAFSDSGFVKAITDKVGKDEKNVTVGDIQDITILNLSSSDLKNLDDLYYFPNLTELTLDGVHLDNVRGIIYAQKINKIVIKNLSIIQNWDGFAGLTNCTFIDIIDNKVSDEDLPKICSGIGKIQSLTELYIRNSYNIDSGRKNTFTNVDCFDNMENKSKIKIIWLDRSEYCKNINGLKNFSSLGRLDFVGAYSLEDIEALKNLNNIWRVQIQFAKCTDFSSLYLLSKMQQIDLVGCSNLKDISFLNNYSELTNIDVSGCSNLEISKLSTVKSIYKKLGSSFKINDSYKKYLIDNDATEVNLSNNNLADLSILGTYPKATKVILNSNNLNSSILNYFKENNNSKITTLYLKENNISDLSWLVNDDGTCTLPNLTKLSLYNNDSIKDLSYLKKYNKLSYLDLSNCDSLTDSSFHKGNDFYLPNSITNLFLYSCGKLESISGLENLKNLNKLNIAYTKITGNNAVTLNSLIKLNYLILGNNGENINLNSIYETINRLNYIALEGNNIESFLKDCNNINFTSLKFDYTNFEYSADASNTNTYWYKDNLDLSNCTNLKYLRLWTRYVKNIKLPDSSDLQYLFLRNMYPGLHFNIPDLSKYENLIALYLDENFLNKNDFNTLCTQLNNKKSLTEIDLSKNSISQIENIYLIGSTENDAKNITINLGNNIIRSLAGIEKLNNNIVSIDFSNNNITDISPLLELAKNNSNKKLTKIVLTGNSQISENDLNKLKQYYTVVY